MRYLEGEEFEAARKWMEQTATVAANALCLKAKCGAIIVKDQRIIGCGYNAPPQDDITRRRCFNRYMIPLGNKHDLTCCVHAEWRADKDALLREPTGIEGSTLYFTRVDEAGMIIRSGAPYCTVCSRQILDSRIAFFILWHEEGIAEYNTREYDDLSYQYAT